MNLLYLTALFPLLGFVILAIGRDRFSDLAASSIAIAAMALAFGASVLQSMDFLSNPLSSEGASQIQILWQWIDTADLNVEFSLLLDGLSLTLINVITGVGLLIHIFASFYMKGEEGVARFFSYLNLFVCFMLLLVLGDNLMLLYLGWEGVGICSYLLIGFYYKDRDNSVAAIKAFTVTRIGDVFLAIGLFMLYVTFDTLSISEILALHRENPDLLTSSSTWASLTALMILGGAMGKSAQLPLHTWLADAMAGPTPVSALIHAATMVTAGVYLIARMNPIFISSPEVLHLVGAVGAVSLLVAGLAACAQTDIKRILAYSTMSQIGYMFLALGAGAWDAAIFHLMSHAFFKALLFLSAGAIIVSLHHEQDVFKMGGLWKKLPFVYACFLVGGGALAALPWITIGFYSKESILFGAYAANQPGLFYAGVFGALLTSFYTLRMIWLTFHGPAKTHSDKLSGWRYVLPLGILLVLSTALGALIHPPLAGYLPQSASSLIMAMDAEHGKHLKHISEIIAIVAGLLGLAIGFVLYVVNGGKWLTKLKTSRFGAKAYAFLYSGLGFDALFDRVFVRPFMWVGRLLQKDPIDRSYGLVSGLAFGAGQLMRQGQHGRLRGNVSFMVIGLIAMLILAILSL